MKGKEIIIRYGIFLGIILIVFPLLLSLFIDAPDYNNKLRATFLLSRTFIILSFSTVIFLAISLEKFPKPKKESFLIRILLFIIAILLVLPAFWTYGSLERNLEMYSWQLHKIQYDSHRWLNLGVFGERGVVKETIEILQDDSVLKRIQFNPNVQDSTLVILASYNISGKHDSNYGLDINGIHYDITSTILSKPKEAMHTYTFQVPHLQEFNVVNLSQQGDDILQVYTQIDYFKKDSFRDGRMLDWQSLLVGFRYKENFLYTLSFKLGILLKIAAVIFVWLSLFGIGFSKNIIRKQWKELCFATIFAFFLIYVVNKIYGLWEYLSKVVGYGVYFLLKISFLHPTISFPGSNPDVGIPGIILNIAETCSGIEGISLFLFVYTLLLIIFWRRIKHKKALFLYIPGVIGVYLVNIVRVYLIFIVAKLIGIDFAVNAFHVNIGMVLFILYSLTFWYVVLKWIKK